MGNEIRKLPPNPNGLVQIARREKNPSKFYIASSDIDMYSAPVSYGLAILHDALERTCEDVRMSIYELADNILLESREETNNNSILKCNYSIINAFELGAFDAKNKLYPLGFYHIPSEYYISACQNPDRLEMELLDIIADSLKE